MESSLRSNGGQIKGEAGRQYAEYLYRQIVPMTHDQYLDEPGDSIQWTVRIHDLVESLRKEREKEERDNP